MYSQLSCYLMVIIVILPKKQLHLSQWSAVSKVSYCRVWIWTFKCNRWCYFQISRMLVVNASERLTAQQCLAHPFLRIEEVHLKHVRNSYFSYCIHVYVGVIRRNLYTKLMSIYMIYMCKTEFFRYYLRFSLRSESFRK